MSIQEMDDPNSAMGSSDSKNAESFVWPVSHSTRIVVLVFIFGAVFGTIIGYNIVYRGTTALAENWGVIRGLFAAFENYFPIYILVLFCLLVYRSYTAHRNFRYFDLLVLLLINLIPLALLWLANYAGSLRFGSYELKDYDYVYMGCVLICVNSFVGLFKFNLQTLRTWLSWYRLIFEMIIVSCLPAILLAVMSLFSIVLPDAGVSRLLSPLFSDLGLVAMLAAGLGLNYVAASSMMSLGLLFDGWRHEKEYFGPLPNSITKDNAPGFFYHRGFYWKLLGFALIGTLPLVALFVNNLGGKFVALRFLFLILGLGIGYLVYWGMARKVNDAKASWWLPEFIHLKVTKPTFDLIQGPDGVDESCHTSALMYFLASILIAILLLVFSFSFKIGGLGFAGFCLVMGNVSWIIGYLNFHFRRMNISIFLLMLVLVFVGIFVPSPNYLSIYKKLDIELPPASASYVPAGVRCKGPDGLDCELVVVSGSGGGIRASVWLIKVLMELAEQDKASLSPDRVGLWSTVSGSSVGLAHYLAQKTQNVGSPEITNLRRALEATKAPSVDAIALGYAFGDFWGSLSLFRAIGLDRGTLLEWKWSQNSYVQASKAPKQTHDAAAKKQVFTQEKKLGGKLTLSRVEKVALKSNDDNFNPIVVMNSTLLETGERVKMEFGERKSLPFRDFDETRRLRDLFDNPAVVSTSSSSLARNYEASIWTIARTSAAFPYVTPAAKPRDMDRFHLIDGGYIENFGTISAIEHIREIVENPKAQKEKFWENKKLKILFVEIFVEQKESDLHLQPVSWLESALFGPLYGISRGIFGRQKNRVTESLEVLKRDLNSEEAYKCVELKHVHFDLKAEGALSWRMRTEDEEKIDRRLKAQRGKLDGVREAVLWLEKISEKCDANNDPSRQTKRKN